MGLEVKIETNAPEMNRFLKLVADRQIPFITAKTLTDLAVHARKTETEKLPRYFTIRTSRTKTSIKSVRADKRDWPNSFSIVGVRDPILAGNITGENRPGAGALPSLIARELLNPGKGTLGPKYFPGQLIEKGDRTDKGKRSKSGGEFKSLTKYGNKPFLMKAKKGPFAGEEVIAIRRSEKRTPIDTLYVLSKKDIKLKKKWPLIDNVSSMVGRLYTPMFSKNLNRALNEIKTPRK